MQFLRATSFLRAIENSVGNKMFRNSFFEMDGQERDIVKNGVLSCALYVSSLLYIYKLIKDVHATVKGTVSDLEKSGWKKVKEVTRGDIIVWEAMKFREEFHSHIGFSIGNGYAISNSAEKKCPIKHNLYFGIKNGRPTRKITNIYRYTF